MQRGVNLTVVVSKFLMIFFLVLVTNPLFAQILPSLNITGDRFDAFLKGALFDQKGNQTFFGDFASDSLFINDQLIFVNLGIKPKISANDEDAFIIKYNKSGNLVYKKQIWCKGKTPVPDFVSPKGEVHGFKIINDIQGNLYVTGTFADDTLYFGDSRLYNKNSGKNGSSLFLVKLDSLGNTLWHKTISGGGDITSLALDEKGICIYGEYGDSVKFDSILLPCFACHVHDVNLFLVRYSLTGKVKWARRISGNDYEYSGDIIYSGNGNYYLNGYFQSTTLIIGNDTLSGLSFPSFLTKFDTSGIFAWAKQSKGLATYVASRKLASDKYGNIYMLGSSATEFSLGNIKVDDKSMLDDMFIAKFDPNGNPIWAKSYKVNILDLTYSDIIIDKFNNIVILGNYYNGGFVMFDSIGLRNKGKEDIFIAKFDNKGDIISYAGFGAEVTDIGQFLLEDSLSGELYISGHYKSEELNIEKNTFANRSSFKSSFFTQVQFIKLGIPFIQNLDLLVYPNPANNFVRIKIPSSLGDTYNIKVYSSNGQLIEERITEETISINTAKYPSGLYLFTISNGKAKSTKKILIHQ